MQSDFEHTAPMHTRSTDDVDLGVKVNRVVPLWGIVLVLGAGAFNVIQNWNAQNEQSKSIARLEASVIALTLKLDGIFTQQNASNLVDAQHELKLGYMNDQLTNLRNRLAAVEGVMPRQYQQAPQTFIQMPEASQPNRKR